MNHSSLRGRVGDVAVWRRPAVSFGSAALAAALFAALPAAAQEVAEAPVVPVADSGDTAWMLTSTVLVLLMTLPGLALFYGGLVRSKNVLSILVQCFAMAGVMSLVWVTFGASFATGSSENLFIGDASKVMLKHLTPELLNGSIPESVWLTFQMTFTIITPALIVGAFAERMKFSAMLTTHAATAMGVVVWAALDGYEEEGLKPVFDHLEGRYSYGKLRLFRAFAEREGSEVDQQQHMQRRTSLRNRHLASVGGPIQPITGEDDILGEMLDDARD